MSDISLPTHVRFVNLTGQRFLLLKVVKYVGQKNVGSIKMSNWECACDCGRTVLVTTNKLRTGHTRSCGCIIRKGHPVDKQDTSKRVHSATTHGMTGTKQYLTWAAMIQRCTNEKCRKYPLYGGRGISVCDRWMVFENFIADMPPRPDGDFTIDRIDNSLGYFPGNCRWATAKQQARNRRSNVILEVNGRSQTIAAWSEETGISHMTITQRMKYGWSVDSAVLTPVLKTWSRKKKEK